MCAYRHIFSSWNLSLVQVLVLFCNHMLTMLLYIHTHNIGIPKYTATKILLDPGIDQSLIAKERPIEVEKSSTFVVDLTCLKDPDDVKKYTYGWWNGLSSRGFPLFIR